MSERFHVYKTGEHEPEHVLVASCWCGPEMTERDPVTGNEVWTHKERKELEQ